ncbi:hypothetical protein ACTQ75_000902 [Vibrio alginolyticus]
MDITSDLICTYLSQRHVLSVQQMVNAKLIERSKRLQFEYLSEKGKVPKEV